MTDFRKKLIVQVTIAVAVVGTLGAGLLFFGKNIRTNGAELQAARMALAERSASLEALALLQTQYTRKAKGYIAVLQGMVPQKEELINISKDFQFLATQSGVSQSFSFLDETPASGGALGSINVRIDVGGSIERIAQFVRGIENFKYVTKIDRVAINRNQNNTLTASIGAHIYFRE